MSAVALPFRIYSPPDECREHPLPLTTLRQVYNRYLQKELKNRAKKTLIEYETLLNDWERLTDDGCVSELTRAALLDFQEQLQIEPKSSGELRSPATINKKFRTFGRLIKLCWPADSHNPAGLGLCDYFRPPEALDETDRLPRTFEFEEIERMYAACKYQTWPRRHPALTWRTILVTHFCCGPRTYDLLSLNSSDIDWHFKQMGSISFQATKTGKLQRIPLHTAARAHLQALQSTLNSDRLFPGFDYSNTSTVRRHWRKLLERANVQDAHMEDMRKTCNTAYNDRWPGVGDFILGHKLSGVNARHYYDPTRKVLHAVQRLKVPDSFLSLN